MTDVKIEKGDIVLDSSGNTVMLSEEDEKFQRAMICIQAKKGSFIYDRQLGSELYKAREDKNCSSGQAQLIINEALAKFDNAFASVLSFGNKIRILLTIDGKTRFVEVD